MSKKKLNKTGRRRRKKVSSSVKKKTYIYIYETERGFNLGHIKLLYIWKNFFLKFSNLIRIHLSSCRCRCGIRLCRCASLMINHMMWLLLLLGLFLVSGVMYSRTSRWCNELFWYIPERVRARLPNCPVVIITIICWRVFS